MARSSARAAPTQIGLSAGCHQVRICARGAARREEDDELCGEYRIPDCWGSLALEMETSEGELFLANGAGQFDFSDGGCCAIKIFEAEHRSGPGFDTAVIVFDQIVNVFG
jgi:hypothetical protein